MMQLRLLVRLVKMMQSMLRFVDIMRYRTMLGKVRLVGLHRKKRLRVIVVHGYVRLRLSFVHNMLVWIKVVFRCVMVRIWFGLMVQRLVRFRLMHGRVVRFWL